jgi:hypothetical protein
MGTDLTRNTAITSVGHSTLLMFHPGTGHTKTRDTKYMRSQKKQAVTYIEANFSKRTAEIRSCQAQLCPQEKQIVSCMVHTVGNQQDYYKMQLECQTLVVCPAITDRDI